MRAREESAEAIVVKTAEETRTERRAEEPAEGDQPTHCGRRGAKSPETTEDRQLRQVPPLAERKRVGGFRHASPPQAASHPPARKEAQDDA